ncbi:aspartyl/glutamyl-tRNA(Asn/Gln) amidotransferases subunit A [Candidatus Rickettsiella viridis]|uniref:Aspartyl/glutamyl-tRNA(Asn/Gln) amidotransferases subunit A n=1 Tax=Candidatus Rickettsiella viridis TaxID=676208 RepID=A0A2Z5UWP5_9COXI|nr:amidase [Candidatus Rickettsiella viridis]BBB15884.1 aspartyl/glutamyl-tRNA(Asn/Gln) amidotransferases subunit A [Candidatus Rickettsiella viridis]
MSSEIYFASAKQLVQRIKQKQISCTELIHIYLDRLTHINPKLNALVQTLSPENALQQARLADEKLAKNQVIGPLHGLPITIKDCCKVKDFVITKGSTGFHFLPTEDATVVERLKAAGAIVIGISNVPEFNIAYETDNDRYGRTLNPYDLTRTPGGSSGGEAAIIAAGGSTFGLGTDAGGSIRQPAHNTGIASLKPTHGLLPNTGKLPYDGGSLSSLTTYGPMARFVDDLILTLPVLSGSPTVTPTQFINFKSLRIAFYTDNTIAKPDEDTLRTIKRVVNSLQTEVAQLEEHCPAHLPEIYSLISETFFLKGDKGLGIKMLLNQLAIKKPSSLVREFLAIARHCELSTTELNQRLSRLDQLRLELETFFINYDAIICPVAATPAKQHGRSFIEGRDFSYLSIYNFTGWPAATVRCGTSLEGLPIGIQIIAKPWQDMTALGLAKKLETLLGGWQVPPLFP